MSLQDRVMDEMSKLEKLCRGNELQFKFLNHSYPAVMLITPRIEDDGQETLFEDISKSPTTAPDGKLEIVFEDGDITIRTFSEFVLDDSILGKIKNRAKKLFLYFTQMYFEASKKLPETYEFPYDYLFIPDEDSYEEESEPESSLQNEEADCEDDEEDAEEDMDEDNEELNPEE